MEYGFWSMVFGSGESVESTTPTQNGSRAHFDALWACGRVVPVVLVVFGGYWWFFTGDGRGLYAKQVRSKTNIPSTPAVRYTNTLAFREA